MENTTQVELSKAAKEQLDELPTPIIARMTRLLERLSEWPKVSGAKRLSGELAGKFRLRTGDYRLQFSVEVKEVEVHTRQVKVGKKTVEKRVEIKQYRIVVEKIGHRDGFYDD